jgi:hypothetical protein
MYQVLFCVSPFLEWTVRGMNPVVSSGSCLSKDMGGNVFIKSKVLIRGVYIKGVVSNGRDLYGGKDIPL